jgi:multimeric flavodoxin WrbA
MLNQQIVILNGIGSENRELDPLLDLLIDTLQDIGAKVQTYTLRNLKMGACVGCFGCWLKTPGICLEPDVGRDIAQAVVQSDTTIIFTPVTFGGYSSEIKKIQDRWLPLILPYFGIYHGEIHHPPRYSHYPRLVGIGIQGQPNEQEAHLFKVLIGRNAINFHAPTYSADVILSNNNPDKLRQQWQNLLVRNDPIPVGEVMTSLMPIPEIVNFPIIARPGRVLLVVGSPKINSPSTSGVLGGYVLEQLQRQGWQGSSLTLRANTFKNEGKAEFIDAVDHADLLIFAFPLYIDALPFLMTKALEIIAAHLCSQPSTTPKRLFAIANNGFPEAHHNALALAICQRFARDTGMIWAGGLAMGAGEALFSGLPLTDHQRGGRPPVQHVIQALDLASIALAAGKPVPLEANRLIAKTPIPFLPFPLWRWLFVKIARLHWQEKATNNQVSQEEILAQPYADVVKIISR